MCGKTRGTRDRWIDTTTLRSVVFGRTVKKNKFFGVDTNAVDRVWYGSAEKGKKNNVVRNTFWECFKASHFHGLYAYRLESRGS